MPLSQDAKDVLHGIRVGQFDLAALEVLSEAELNEMLAEPSSMNDSRARDAIRAVLERKLADRMRAQTAALQDAVGQVGQLMSALTETLATSARRAERLNVWLVALTVAIVVLTAVMAVPAGHQIVALLRGAPGRLRGSTRRLEGAARRRTNGVRAGWARSRCRESSRVGSAW